MYNRFVSNAEIAQVLEQIALILELKGNENPFRVRAYERAAANIYNLSGKLRDVYDKGGNKALQALPGIGKDLAEKIEEMLKTGKLKYLKEIEKSIPPGLLEIMDIEGMGPKRTKELWEEFYVQSLKGLKKLAESEDLRTRKGWGEKSAENILRGIEQHSKVSGRLPIPEAAPLVAEIIAALKKSGHCKQIAVAGSFRRSRDTVGDIDILATSKKPEAVMDVFCSLPQVDSVTVKGSTKSTVFLRAGLDADLRVVEDDAFGAALLYFTGSKAHNIAIRRLGIKKKLTLSEYGLYKGSAKKKGAQVAARTEEEVYKAIGLPFIPPELREDQGEIEAAQKKKLPKLVELKDVCSDLHMHSLFSDGRHSMTEMARGAKRRGLKYIAITDHASPMGMVNGIQKTKKSMQSYLKKIEEARKAVPDIHILAGVEVDILKDGSLYLPDDLLKEFDWVVAAVHQYFHETPADTTERLIKAIQNPHVHLIGHPTARLLGKRAGIEFDMEAVLKAAKKYGVAMEINTGHDRLDLNAAHLKQAKKIGVDICISSDAHTPQGLEYSFGIAQARRGWLEKKDIVNMKPWKEFEKWRKRR